MTALYICGLIVWGIALARIDFAEHRLPDRLTLPAYPVGMLIVAELWPTRLVDAGRWAIVFAASAALMAIVADLGWGDVKLLGALGIMAGGAGTVTATVLLIVALGGLHAVTELVITRDRRSYIPFGPAILVGFVPVALAVT